MAFPLRENVTNLFKNDRKTNDKQPDWKGKLLINGEEYEIALWEREGQRGMYLGCKVGRPYQGRRQPGDEDINY